ncbi:glutamate synthase subunit beta [bacterium]|nr:glutamate synthase subunit beta [bacterium]
MANPVGFLEFSREDSPRRPFDECMRDYREEELLLPLDRAEQQADRCMDCGIPFCQMSGCPLRNRIPDWCTMVSAGNWRQALDLLHATNNFPEITGRVCPAPCESACTLSVNGRPVNVKHIELLIGEYGWGKGWILPAPSPSASDKKVAVIGSGPAGLSAAQQLSRFGHSVTVFEKDDRIGGILRYGIPDFILEKRVIDRRIEQMMAEGVTFEAGVDAGTDLSVRYLRRSFDAAVIAVGLRAPRDIHVPGRDLEGIVFATKFLSQQNRRVAGDSIPAGYEITAKDRDVVIIGAGETGSYCTGTCLRQGARSVHILELLPENGEEDARNFIWCDLHGDNNPPSTESPGCTTLYGVTVQRFNGKDNRIRSVVIEKSSRRAHDSESGDAAQNTAGAATEIKADLVIIAAGFSHLEYGPLVHNLSLDIDECGNLMTDPDGMTTVDGVFASGDCVMGASTVVHALYHGRRIADSVDRHLLKGIE